MKDVEIARNVVEGVVLKLAQHELYLAVLFVKLFPGIDIHQRAACAGGAVGSGRLQAEVGLSGTRVVERGVQTAHARVVWRVQDN